MDFPVLPVFYHPEVTKEQLDQVGVSCVLDDSARGLLHHPNESLHQKISIVEGTLTTLLAVVYFGSVIGLQSLLHGFTGANQLTIVGSTLLIAALFQPLRHRIQNIIDRRFYRRKYDTARTLAAFSAVLRNEVDLDRLREQLIEVVQETMQPSHVSLWLRPPEQDLKQTTQTLSEIDD